MGRQPTRRRRRGRGNGSGRMCGGRGASAEEGRRGQGVSAAMAAGMMASREGSRERTGGRHGGARGHGTPEHAGGTRGGDGDGAQGIAALRGRRGPLWGKHPRFRTRPRRPGTGTDTGGLPRADGGTGSTTRRDDTRRRDGTRTAPSDREPQTAPTHHETAQGPATLLIVPARTDQTRPGLLCATTVRRPSPPAPWALPIRPRARPSVKLS